MLAAALGLCLVGVLVLWLVAPPGLTPEGYAAHVWKCLIYAKDFGLYAIEAGLTTNLTTLHVQSATTAGVAVFLAGVLIVGLAGLVLAQAGLKPNDSRFANASEIKRMGLHGDLGPVLGDVDGHVLKPDETRHTCVIAPTRGGKTRTAISTVLDWPGSIVIVDPKSDIRKITNPYRSKLGPTYAIDWADPDTPDGWNFLSLRSIPQDPVKRERKALRYAGVMVPENAQVKDPIWENTARRNTAAFVLFEMCEALREERDGHIRNVRDCFMDLPVVENDPDDEPLDAFTLKMETIAATARKHGYPKYLIETVDAMGQMRNGSERSSHISTLNTKFQHFASEASRNALGKDSFEFADLRSRPTTIYIDFPQEDAASFGGLTALFLDSLVAWSLGEGRNQGEYPILLIIDEFRDLPFIGQLPSLFTKGAGAGVAVMVIVQSLEQIRERYTTTSHNLLDNFEYFVVFGLPNHETQKMLSAIVGERSIEKTSETKQGLSLFGSNTKSEQREQLIKPSDWGVIPFGSHILLANRHFIRPVYCKSAFWDKIRKYRKRVPRKNRIKT